MKSWRKLIGVTLLEVLLVMVISSAILLMVATLSQQKTDEIRRTRLILQLQQVLNAGLSYYVLHGTWPISTVDLINENFLPRTFTSPFRESFLVIGKNKDTQNDLVQFYVTTRVPSSAIARIVAGTLPLGFVSDAAGSVRTPPTLGVCDVPRDDPLPAECTYIVASVNIPGQNLNNSTAINRAGLYHNGACVPVPVCPVRGMTPQVLVVPAQVNGVFEAPEGGLRKLYPLSSFTAYAKGPPSLTPPGCQQGAGDQPCEGVPGTATYWRVCLRVETEKGVVAPTSASWGKASGTILAVTRCAMQSEPSESSTFDVWAQ